MESGKQHKLFVLTCEIGESRQVTAADCERCPHGKVIDNRSKVVCAGSLRFFMTPCGFDMRSAATVKDCEECKSGDVREDRIRVYCSRM